MFCDSRLEWEGDGKTEQGGKEDVKRKNGRVGRRGEGKSQRER